MQAKISGKKEREKLMEKILEKPDHKNETNISEENQR